MIVWVCFKRGIEIQWQIHTLLPDTQWYTLRPEEKRAQQVETRNWMVTLDTWFVLYVASLSSIYSYLLGKCNRMALEVGRPSIPVILEIFLQAEEGECRIWNNISPDFLTQPGILISHCSWAWFLPRFISCHCHLWLAQLGLKDN